MTILLLFVCAAVAALALWFVQMGLRSMIAHQMIHNALAGIRAQRWDLLVSYTGERSLRWRFYNRHYIRLVALEARKKLSSLDVATWQKSVDRDQVLRLHAAELEGKGSKDLEDYLITQYRNDVTLLPATNAVFVWIGASLAFSVAVILIIYVI